MRGIVLFAHGSREPGWARPFEEIRERVRAGCPGCPIELAFLEIMAPPLEDAVASLVGQGALAITVFPLFMGQGGHLRHDLPLILEAIQARHPGVPIALEKASGDVGAIQAAIAGWIVERSA